MYRITVDREVFPNGIVSELRIHGSEDVYLVLRGFGHHSESIGSVRYTPGQDKARVILDYLTENGL